MTTTSTESTIAAPEKVGNEFLVGRGDYSSITNLTNGGFVVSLASVGGVALEVFDAMGTKVGEGGVSDTIIGVQGDSNITGLTNGYFVLTWTSGNGQSGVADVKAQVFDTTGAKVGSEFLVNTTTESGQNLSTITGLTNGGFVITWVDGSGLGGDSSVSSIKAQVFDAAGGKIGGEFLVNTTTEAQQNFPTITGLSDGGFVVTWSDRSGLDGDPFPRSIKAQVFDAPGTKVGSEFLVNTTTAGSQNIPIIGALNDGGFVIAWSDSNTGVKAQVFDATGTKVGSEFLVNTGGGGAAIVGQDGGGFVIAWGDGSSDFSDVKAQLFDATGAKVGSEFLVNTTTVGHQSAPTITGLSNGGLVVAWHDGSDPSIDNLIKAQIFHPTDITGTSGNDNLTGTAGDDTIDALDGFDTVNAGPGNDTVFGGAGNDFLNGEIGNDVIHGGDGDDFISGGAGSDTLFGESGNDNFQQLGSSNQNGTSADGGTGNDTFGTSWYTNTTITTGADSDTIRLFGGDNSHKVTVTDFTAGSGGDALDISNMLSFSLTGWNASTNPFATGFLRLIQNGTDTELQWDQNGATGGAVWTTFVTLQNVTASSLTLANFLPNYPPVVFANAIPTITSDGGGDTTNLTVAENTKAVTTVTSSDPDAGQTLSYSISGGVDAGKFTIGSTTGALSFITAPNFEAPTDADGNNVYDVTVQISDGHGGIDTQVIAVTVQNVIGVTINGTAGNDLIDATHTVEGQPLPTNDGDIIYGHNGRDTINGLGGNDTINGGADSDTMTGGAGDDIYIVDNTGDVAIESAAEGTDTIQSSVTYRLSANVENLSLTGGGSINGTGNALDNTIIGGNGNNILAGLAGADTLDGRLGNDTASYAFSAGVNVSLATGHSFGGDAQDDKLISIENVTGSAFEDTLEGDSGNNVLAGGTGADTVSYEHAAAGVRVSLAVTAAQNTLGAGTDTLSGLENLTGSAFNDTLTGNGLANRIDGGAGNDIMNGGAGNDTLQGGADNDILTGGAGADVLDGGGGNDTASYAGSAFAVTADLNVGIGLVGGEAQRDTLTNIENLIGSSAFSNALIGDGNDNVLTGGASRDILTGGGNGASGDTASYATATAGVTVSLQLQGGAQNTVGAGVDTLTGIENLIGSAFNDTLTGDGNDNVLTGGAGNDTLLGGAGDDTLDGGAGTADTASYATAGSGVTVSLLLQGGPQNTGGAGVDTLTGFERLIGSAFNDTLSGDGLANRIDGGAGDDTIDGGAGNDILIGGLHSAAGDTISYVSSAAGVTVSLAIQDGVTAQNTVGAGTDTLSGFEHLTGSAFNDTLTGNGLNNRIDGGAGNDIINGGAGNDSLQGGADNDVLIGGAGADALDGGDGNDTASYAGSTVAVTVDLNAGTGLGGDAQGDTLSGIENLIGSAFNDTLTGDANDNVLAGGAGNDTLQGGAGTDTLKGGAGIDTLIGGMDADSFVFDSVLNKLTNVDNVVDFQTGVDHIGLENSIFTKLVATGTLAADFFHVGTAAADANDFIIYDDATGALYYDSNGSATGQQVQFAHLDPGLTLTHSDFFVI